MDDDPVEAAENGWDPDFKHDQLMEGKGGVEGGDEEGHEGGEWVMLDPAMAEKKTDSAV